MFLLDHPDEGLDVSPLGVYDSMVGTDDPVQCFQRPILRVNHVQGMVIGGEDCG